MCTLEKRGCSMPEGFVVSDLLPNSDISSLVNMDTSSLYHCKLSGATLATLAIELVVLCIFRLTKKKSLSNSVLLLCIVIKSHVAKIWVTWFASLSSFVLGSVLSVFCDVLVLEQAKIWFLVCSLWFLC